MATDYANLLQSAKPIGTNGLTVWKPKSLFLSAGPGDPYVFAMTDDTVTKTGLSGCILVPANYLAGQSPQIVAYWYSTTTTGNAAFEFGYQFITGDDTTSVDPATVDALVTWIDAAPGGSGRLLQQATAIVAAGVVAGGLLFYQFYLDGSASGCTIGGVVLLQKLVMVYTKDS